MGARREGHPDHFESHIRDLMNTPVAENLGGDLLLQPDDVDRATHERALKALEKVGETDPERGEEVQRVLFEVVTKAPRPLNLCIQNIG